MTGHEPAYAPSPSTAAEAAPATDAAQQATGTSAAHAHGASGCQDILNDGWADDVVLHYPDEPKTNTDATAPTPPPAEPAPAAQAAKHHGFGVFLLLWCIALIALAACALIYFYHFLLDYEAAYEASRPYHAMESLIEDFQERGATALYHMASNPPEAGAFEDEERLIRWMETTLSDCKYSYQTAPDTSPSTPSYLLLANNQPIGEVRLHPSPVEPGPYGLPVWHLWMLTLDLPPKQDIHISALADDTVYVNGILLGDTYRSTTASTADVSAYVAPYATLPATIVYDCGGFYAPPEVTALHQDGSPALVDCDEQTGLYTVSYGMSEAQLGEMSGFALRFASDYALYLSNDLPEDALDQYFPPDDATLLYLRHNSLRQYYPRHTAASIRSSEVCDLHVYSEDIYSCEVLIQQELHFGAEDDTGIVPTDVTFYIVRIDGAWKVTGIAF